MNSKTLSIIALVCGIVGVAGCWFGVVSIIALVAAVVGIVFGAMGVKKAKEENAPKGLAVAGLVCGIVGTSFALIGVICAACAVCVLGNAANSLEGIAELSSSIY